MYLDPSMPVVELIKALGGLDPDAATRRAGQIEVLLHHDDPDVREEAARALFVRAKHGEERETLVAMLTNDPAIEVRCVAAYGLAATSAPGSLSADSRLLASIVENEGEDLEVRGSAYDALLILHRRAAFPSKKHQFNPARDIDWEWMRAGGWN